MIILDNRGVGRSQGKTPDSVEASGQGRNRVHRRARARTGRSDRLFCARPAGPYSPYDFCRHRSCRRQRHERSRCRLEGAFQNAATQKNISSTSCSSQTKMRRRPPTISCALASAQERRDPAASNETTQALSAAIVQWGKSDGAKTERDQPSRSRCHGNNDIMVPTINSVALFQALPNAQLSIFPDARGSSNIIGNSPSRLLLRFFAS